MRLVALAAALALALPAAAQGGAFPVGTYAIGPPAPADARFVFGADGSVAAETDDERLAGGTYRATPTLLVLTLTAPDDDCDTPELRTGIYAWTLADGTLTLEAVEDPCDDRREALEQVALTPSAPATAAPAVHPTFPAGAYRPSAPAPPSTRVVFGADGAFSATDGDETLAAGHIVVTAAHLVLTIDDGDADCLAPALQTGVYAWSLDGDVLSLAPVDDPCEERAESLAEVTFAPVAE